MNNHKSEHVNIRGIRPLFREYGKKRAKLSVDARNGIRPIRFELLRGDGHERLRGAEVDFHRVGVHEDAEFRSARDFGQGGS